MRIKDMDLVPVPGLVPGPDFLVLGLVPVLGPGLGLGLGLGPHSD